jgi:hypothetical protein
MEVFEYVGGKQQGKEAQGIHFPPNVPLQVFEKAKIDYFLRYPTVWKHHIKTAEDIQTEKAHEVDSVSTLERIEELETKMEVMESLFEEVQAEMRGNGDSIRSELEEIKKLLKGGK